MAGKRIIKPSISIGGTEFKCMSRSVTLEPGDIINFCEREWNCSVDIELSYGVGGSHTVLAGFEGTEQEVIISPSDGAVSADNPSATFTAEIPPIPFMAGAERGERQTFTLELTSDDPPVIATS
jgi:hypothetical protein